MTLPISASLLLLQQGGFGSAPAMIFMYGAIFLIFYLVLWRPQQRQRKTHEALIQQIKRGDQIVTAGGIVGEVVNIAQAVKDGTATPSLSDHVTIRSGESRLIVERGRIARVVVPTVSNP